MAWQKTLLISTFLFVITEQRPTIFVDSETDLLEEIRPIRSIQSSETTTVLPESSTEVPEDSERRIRSTNDREDTETTEATTKLNKETTVDASTEENLDAFAIFVKISAKAMENPVQKRSVETLQDKEGAEDLEDLDTAANTVFRPLFAYRQQNEQRRRLRTLQNA